MLKTMSMATRQLLIELIWFHLLGFLKWCADRLPTGAKEKACSKITWQKSLTIQFLFENNQNFSPFIFNNYLIISSQCYTLQLNFNLQLFHINACIKTMFFIKYNISYIFSSLSLRSWWYATRFKATSV